MLVADWFVVSLSGGCLLKLTWVSVCVCVCRFGSSVGFLLFHLVE